MSMPEKKLRSGLYADVKNISKDVSKDLDIEIEQNAIDLIGELVWKKLLLYSQDLEAFQKHAKRSTITTDDVKLLCRRNASLKEFVERECLNISKAEGSNINKKKRKAPSNIIDD